MGRITDWMGTTFGIFLLAVVPFIYLLYAYEDATQSFLDHRYFGVGIILAFVVTYLIYRGESEFRKPWDNFASWLAVLTLFMVLVLFNTGEISRNLFGSYLLYYLFVLFWDWRRL